MARSTSFPCEIGESILGHQLSGVAGVYNVYADADEMRKWLDRWGEHVAGIASPRAKPARAKRQGGKSGGSQLLID